MDVLIAVSFIFSQELLTGHFETLDGASSFSDCNIHFNHEPSHIKIFFEVIRRFMGRQSFNYQIRSSVSPEQDHTTQGLDALGAVAANFRCKLG